MLYKHKQKKSENVFLCLILRLKWWSEVLKGNSVKAKIQMGIGLFAAIVVGIGIFIMGQAIAAEYDTGVTYLGVFAYLIILGVYVFALIMKKLTLGRIALLIFCVFWITSFLFIIALIVEEYYFFSMFFEYALNLNWLVWPFDVFIFFWHPNFIDNGLFCAELFCAVCFLLVTVLLWIGTSGVGQLVKAENESNNKSLSRQKDKDPKEDQNSKTSNR